jgi:hypothetical protein
VPLTAGIKTHNQIGCDRACRQRLTEWEDAQTPEWTTHSAFVEVKSAPVHQHLWNIELQDVEAKDQVSDRHMKVRFSTVVTPGAHHDCLREEDHGRPQAKTVEMTFRKEFDEWSP